MSKRGLICALALVALAGCKKSATTAESVPSQSVIQQNVPPQGSTTHSQTLAPLQTSQTSSAQPSTVKPSKTSPADPQFGWSKYDEENFAIAPLQGRFFVVPRNTTRLRVEINADSAVYAGAVNKADMKDKGVVNASNFRTLPCSFVRNAHGLQDCSLDPQVQDVFVLRDVREKPTLPKTQSAENRVRISLSAWACVSNCKPLTGNTK